MTKFCDYFLAIVGIVILSPVFILAAIAIRMDSKGSILYRQSRVGKKGKDFKVLKFRTMYVNSDKIQLITTSLVDKRITKVGYYIRKYKIDELPQLLNVLRGEMSIVGPRPELREYVKNYTKAQQEVLQRKPGITDLASLIFINENQILGNVDNPERFYVEKILPIKIRLNRVYITKSTASKYFSIIGWTLFSIFHVASKRLRQVNSTCKSRIHANIPG